MKNHQLPEWVWLKEQADALQRSFDLRSAFAREASRFSDFALRAPHLRADLSKQHWTLEIREGLLALADAVDLAGSREGLFKGAKINHTENRSVDHVCWRKAAMSGQPNRLDDMLDLAELIRANPAIDDIVHIGIGGSGLGPELVLQALASHQNCRQRIHVVSNLDGHALQEVLKGLDARRTLFIVVSKSWSTRETLINAESAAAWFIAGGGQDLSQHFIAVSSRPDRAQAFGAGVVLDMPEGMGGRFSVWSAVGLPVAIALGADGFRAMLCGAIDMDDHFALAPADQNVPLCMGLLDVWNASFLAYAGRCVVPYHHGLRRLPAYLQQLEMESNGKRVGQDGVVLPYHTAGVVWGEEGSNSQHAFFQWLHQGTWPLPVELLAVLTPSHDLMGHHDVLLANALAQGQALMLGSQAGQGQLSGHQDFPGNRPSTLLLLDRLDPPSLGALLALYEHRVFVAGVIWGINSFDQWGVELGKTLACDIEERLNRGNMEGIDGSTAGAIQWILEARQP